MHIPSVVFLLDGMVLVASFWHFRTADFGLWNLDDQWQRELLILA